MSEKEELISQEQIESHIFEIRGQKVILDFDLATIYSVSTKVFNQAVRRNQKRFPKGFMFQLSKPEFKIYLVLYTLMVHYNPVLSPRIVK